MQEIIEKIDEFNKERDWDQFHSPENLAKSIVIEAGELLECFQWDSENYNKEEVQKAKKEHRKAELLPKVSAHVMRHTACTRMAECRMDIKVLQYIMGHAHIDVTMDVYNHLGDRERIEQEIARLDSMAVNF